MDKLQHYRTIVQRIVAYHAQFSAGENIDVVPIIDTVHDRYLLMDVGWRKTGRVHSIAFHIFMCDEKIYIEWDGTEYGIAQELIDAGIPPEDIVLAFYRHQESALAVAAL